jgi:uncharacterized protein YbbK (DUF523 family)
MHPQPVIFSLPENKKEKKCPRMKSGTATPRLPTEVGPHHALRQDRRSAYNDRLILDGS